MRRQRPNVERMHLLGAEVRAVEFGTRTLKEALSEAIRDWITNVETTHYLIGTCAGPAPYPELVRDLQAVIGREASAADARADRQPARRRRRLRRRRLERHRHVRRLPRRRRRSADRRRGGGGRLADGRPADGAPRRALVDARRTKTARSSTRTRSRPGSTTRASAPSTPGSGTPAASSTRPPPTARRWPRSTCSPSARGSSRRSSPRTRSPAQSSSTRRSCS